MAWGGISDWYRNVYLRSEHWREYRLEKLDWDNYRCADCMERATQVHHRPEEYAFLWHETVEQCVSLCAECHLRRHDHGEPSEAEREERRVRCIDCGADAETDDPALLCRDCWEFRKHA
jgi:hypothetical protein